MREVRIQDKFVGTNHPTFVVAEVGINHNGKLELAYKMIEKANECGADAVKFQTYITEKRVPRNSPVYDVLKKCELNESAHFKLKHFCDDLGIIFFSTPFDRESISLLNNLNVPAYKVASFDIVNKRLLREIAGMGKPVLISRGMADKQEIDAALNIFKLAKIPPILLHCISAYPTNVREANLNVIRTLLKEYDCPIGYSDHTLDVNIPILAVAVGAKLIEKHFTLDKSMDGPDHRLSADPNELRKMISQIREVEDILGQFDLRIYDAERGTLTYRRETE